MPPVLISEVEQVGTCLVVVLRGDLAVETAPVARLAILKCVADQPDAVLIDLSGVTVVQTVALTVFAATARRASVWPGIPVMLCASAAATAGLLAGGGYGRIPVFASINDAMAALPERQILSLSETLLPVHGAARRARRLAAEACTRWDVPQLTPPASVVADEFVTRALGRAPTMIDIRLARRRRYLMIAVHAGNPAGARSPMSPVPGHPADVGILLLDGVTRRWGCRSIDGGWVAWAMLNIERSS
jgi:anti-anti-sigma regulatory factor